MQCKTERATRVCDQCTYDRRRNLSWGNGKSHLCFVCFAVREKKTDFYRYEVSSTMSSRMVTGLESSPGLHRAWEISLCAETVRLHVRFITISCLFLPACVVAMFIPLSRSCGPLRLFPQERHADTPELINHTFTAIETAGSGELLCSLCDRPAARRSGQAQSSF